MNAIERLIQNCSFKKNTIQFIFFNKQNDFLSLGRTSAGYLYSSQDLLLIITLIDCKYGSVLKQGESSVAQLSLVVVGAITDCSNAVEVRCLTFLAITYFKRPNAL